MMCAIGFVESKKSRRYTSSPTHFSALPQRHIQAVSVKEETGKCHKRRSESILPLPLAKSVNLSVSKPGHEGKSDVHVKYSNSSKKQGDLERKNNPEKQERSEVQERFEKQIQSEKLNKPSNFKPAQSDAKNSHTRAHVNSPKSYNQNSYTSASSTKPQLPKRVRFMMDDKRDKYGSSSSSVSSEESFIDPRELTPRTNYYSSHQQPRKPLQPCQLGRSQAHTVLGRTRDAYSWESNDFSTNHSGNILKDGALKQKPKTSQRHSRKRPKARPGLPKFWDEHTTFEEAYHKIRSLLRGDGDLKAEIPPKSPSDHSSESSSDEERKISYIDSHFQSKTPILAPDSSTRGWGDDFFAWLQKLDQNEAAEPSSPHIFTSRASRNPILAYKSKGEEAAYGEVEPMFVVKDRSLLDRTSIKVPKLNKSEHTSASNFRQADVYEEIGDPGDKSEEDESDLCSYYSTSAIDIKEKPVRWNPGLGIFWRDV